MDAAQIIGFCQHIVGCGDHQRKRSFAARLGNRGLDAFDDAGLCFAKKQAPRCFQFDHAGQVSDNIGIVDRDQNACIGKRWPHSL